MVPLPADVGAEGDGEALGDHALERFGLLHQEGPDGGAGDGRDGASVAGLAQPAIVLGNPGVLGRAQDVGVDVVDAELSIGVVLLLLPPLLLLGVVVLVAVVVLAPGPVPLGGGGGEGVGGVGLEGAQHAVDVPDLEDATGAHDAHQLVRDGGQLLLCEGGRHVLEDDEVEGGRLERPRDLPAVVLHKLPVHVVAVLVHEGGRAHGRVLLVLAAAAAAVAAPGAGAGAGVAAATTAAVAVGGAGGIGSVGVDVAAVATAAADVQSHETHGVVAALCEVAVAQHGPDAGAAADLEHATGRFHVLLR